SRETVHVHRPVPLELANLAWEGGLWPTLQVGSTGIIKLPFRLCGPRLAKKLLPIARVLLHAHELFRSRRSGEDQVVVTPVGGQRDGCLGVRGSLAQQDWRQGQHCD